MADRPVLITTSPTISGDELRTTADSEITEITVLFSSELIAKSELPLVIIAVGVFTLK